MLMLLMQPKQYLSYLVERIMVKKMKKLYLILLIALFSCDFHISKDIIIEAKENISKDIITVNGDITLKDSVELHASISTVNGDIYIYKNAFLDGHVNTINGNIFVGNSAKGQTKISALNGNIDIDSLSQLAGEVSSVSGRIRLNNVKLDGNLVIQYGRVELLNRSQVNSIIIEKKEDIPEKLRKVEISLADSSTVVRDIINKSRDVMVVLDIGQGSEVRGEVIDVEVSRGE